MTARVGIGVGLGLGLPAALGSTLPPPTLGLNFLLPELDPRITFSRPSEKSGYYTPDGVLGTASNNEWLREFHPVSPFAPRGRSVWEAATNRVLYSEDMFGAGWNRVNLLSPGSGSVQNYGIAPDGSQTADLLIESTATGGHYTEALLTRDANIEDQFRAYVKPHGRDDIILQVYDWSDTASSLYCRVNASTGVFITEPQARGSATITGGYLRPLKNGWCEIVMRGTPGTSTGGQVRVRVMFVGNNSTSYTGDGESGAMVWGVSTGIGPYIPTSGSAVTRSADVVSITGADFSQWFNPEEGTFVVEYAVSGPQPTSYQTIFSLDAGSLGEAYVAFVEVNNGTLKWRSQSGGQAVDAITSAANSGVFVCAYSPEGIAASLNGGSVVEKIGPPAPTGLTTLRLGHRLGPLAPLNGHIRRIVYYPKRLPNDVLQMLSGGVL